MSSSNHKPRTPGSLSAFSYAILILVGEGSAAPHDLRRMSLQGARIYWSAAESRWYSEPKRLATDGYLIARKEPGRTHERTVYELSEKGRRAVAEWLERPSEFIRIQNEPAARLTGADLASDPQALAQSLIAIRPHIAEQREWLQRAERVAAELPARERFLRVNHRLSHRILDAFEDWLGEAEAELGRAQKQRAQASE